MAVPPARWSQSSGWAPKAMTFNRPSVAGASVRCGAGCCADTRVETVARAASAIGPTDFHTPVEAMRFIDPPSLRFGPARSHVVYHLEHVAVHRIAEEEALERCGAERRDQL